MRRGLRLRVELGDVRSTGGGEEKRKVHDPSADYYIIRRHQIAIYGL